MRKPFQLLLAYPFVCSQGKHKFSVGPFDAPNGAIQVCILALRRNWDRTSSHKSVGRCRSLNFPSNDLFATNTVDTVAVGENCEEPSRLCRHGGVAQGCSHNWLLLVNALLHSPLVFALGNNRRQQKRSQCNVTPD